MTRLSDPSCQWIAIARRGENFDSDIEVAVRSMRSANSAAEEVSLSYKRLSAGPFRDRSLHIFDIHTDFSLNLVTSSP